MGSLGASLPWQETRRPETELRRFSVHSPHRQDLKAQGIGGRQEEGAVRPSPEGDGGERGRVRRLGLGILKALCLINLIKIIDIKRLRLDQNKIFFSSLVALCVLHFLLEKVITDRNISGYFGLK